MQLSAKNCVLQARTYCNIELQCYGTKFPTYYNKQVASRKKKPMIYIA